MIYSPYFSPDSSLLYAEMVRSSVFPYLKNPSVAGITSTPFAITRKTGFSPSFPSSAWVDSAVIPQNIQLCFGVYYSDQIVITAHPSITGVTHYVDGMQFFFTGSSAPLGMAFLCATPPVDAVMPQSYLIINADDIQGIYQAASVGMPLITKPYSLQDYDPFVLRDIVNSARLSSSLIDSTLNARPCSFGAYNINPVASIGPAVPSNLKPIFGKDVPTSLAGGALSSEFVKLPFTDNRLSLKMGYIKFPSIISGGDVTVTGYEIQPVEDSDKGLVLKEVTRTFTPMPNQIIKTPLVTSLYSATGIHTVTSRMADIVFAIKGPGTLRLKVGNVNFNTPTQAYTDLVQL